MNLEDENSGIPSLGKEPLKERLRRYFMALGLAVAVMAGLFAVFFIILALSLPWLGNDEDEAYEDVTPVILEKGVKAE
ncbi:MAG: hypothetical protein PVF65_11170 [Sphingomonadales bacterium]|jgi:hypothetical protein